MGQRPAEVDALVAGRRVAPGVAGNLDVDLDDRAVAAAEELAGLVRGHREQPRPDTFGIAKGAEPAPGDEPGRLDRVLGELTVPAGNEGNAVDLVGVRPGTAKRHLTDLRARSSLSTAVRSAPHGLRLLANRSGSGENRLLDPVSAGGRGATGALRQDVDQASPDGAPGTSSSPSPSSRRRMSARFDIRCSTAGTWSKPPM